jgi:hypothetical protein
MSEWCITEESGLSTYHGDTFKIVLHRYSDPKRFNLARNAAIYLGKSDRDNIRRPLSIIRQGHVKEIFKGEMAEFEFIDVSKEVYDHITTYTTRNMRVAGGNRALTADDFTMPSDKMKMPTTVKNTIQESMNNYSSLLALGETPQVARSAMPVNAKLNPFVLQFNLVTLMEALFTQRIWEKGAQGNTVKVVKGMWELVHHTDPELWDCVYEYYGPHVYEWKKTQQTMRKKRMFVSDLIEELKLNFVGNADAESALRQLFGQSKSMWE